MRKFDWFISAAVALLFVHVANYEESERGIAELYDPQRDTTYGLFYSIDGEWFFNWPFLFSAVAAYCFIMWIWRSEGPQRRVRKLVHQIMRRERDQSADIIDNFMLHNIPHGFVRMYESWAYGKAPESDLAREVLGVGWMEPEQFEVVRLAVRQALLANDAPNQNE